MSLKRKQILAVSVVVIIIAVGFIVVYSQGYLNNESINRLSRVACLGDSITQITGYPADLQALLGKGSAVGNFGASGSTVNFESGNSYFYDVEFRHALLFEPTIVIIMLGTNDAKTNVYQEVKYFEVDYEIIIRSIQVTISNPRVFLVEPPPIFNNTLGLNSTDFAQGIIPRIQEVANYTGLPLINLYTPLLNHPEYFPDGVHPNSEGAQIIAETIYKAIASKSASS